MNGLPHTSMFNVHRCIASPNIASSPKRAGASEGDSGHYPSSLFERESVYQNIVDILHSFESNIKNLQFKKGIYIYGGSGSGKTYFVMKLLNDLNYDVIRYDAGDVRNKNLIDTITCNNISNKNVLHMMNRKIKKIAIVMDEIDGMNNGDKGGITALIKLIRQKKTKKQKSENSILTPIICIGNYTMDKKIKELMKVCHIFEIKNPTSSQIEQLLKIEHIEPTTSMLEYIQGDFRKFEFVKRVHKFSNMELHHIEGAKMDVLYPWPHATKYIDNYLPQFNKKSQNDDSKKITYKLLQSYIPIEKHSQFMNETERTIVSLLYHENIVDILMKSPERAEVSEGNESISGDAKNALESIYSQILENICFADHIDRITFQNQIWVFNEMSSLIKTFYNNFLYHTTQENDSNKPSPDIRFTKVLTKYSTEYNNQLFLYNLCQELEMDKKDLFAFFYALRIQYGKCFYNYIDRLNKVFVLFENTNITRLDIKRMYRYLDKNDKLDTAKDGDEDANNDEGDTTDD